MTEETRRRGRREITLRHLDQRWWPAEGLEKRDAIAYYEGIAPVLLPHLRDRPFTFKRYPNGPRGPCFWIKDLPPEAPAWFRTAPQPAKSRDGAPVRYAVVADEASLLWAVDFGAIDLHVWSARADKPDRPDYAIFDLDPKGGGDAAEAALVLREALDALGLESYPRTSGHAGMHVLVPLARVHEYDEVRTFVSAVARAVHRARPRLGVAIDVKMNGHGQQFVAAYSLRPKTARVCTPLVWDEVSPELDPARFTVAEVLRRVERLGDVHAGVLRRGQRLARALGRFGG